MKSIIKRFFVVAIVMAAAIGVQAQPILNTHVETGDVQGVLEEGLAVYKAIPYAAPPVGQLRWRAPQPAKAWQGVRVCDQFGPMPPQPTRPGRTADRMSEDCLYLGIATPATSVSDKLPVMVWIHGGGFQTEWYGGDLWKRLAQRGVVIVSIEYRTGALGFMAHPELTKSRRMAIRATTVCSTRFSLCNGCSVISPSSVATPLRLLFLARVPVPSAAACCVLHLWLRDCSVPASVIVAARLLLGATSHVLWGLMPLRRVPRVREWLS